MTEHDAPPPIEILLVEDNEGDVRLTLEVLRDSRVPSHVTVAWDGVEALSVLRRTPPHGAAPRPDLILLDINLPRKNGLEVLSEVKADPDLAAIPVVMLTTSEADRDVVRSYRLHANCYVTKPVGLEAFIGAVRAIETFWLSMARLPKGS